MILGHAGYGFVRKKQVLTPEQFPYKRGYKQDFPE